MEVCVDSMESVSNAYRGGAKRLELCSALTGGGLTPSVGFMTAARRYTDPDFPIYVMIRPRGGPDFNYSPVELEIMEEDIAEMKRLGANGFVFGCTSQGSVDKQACRKLLQASSPLPCTFHRAFDFLSNPEEALKDVIALGFTRLLTSGCASNAHLGRDLICKLVASSKSSGLIVMPGAGLKSSNLREVLLDTGAVEFHGSATLAGTSVTSEAEVREMVQIAKSLGIE